MMDSCNLDQADKSSPETFSDSSLSPESPDSNDIFGEPLVHPRVGDEYQVEIPSMQHNSELSQLMMNPADLEGVIDSSHSFLMGLPLPVMWICNQANSTKGKMETLNNSHAVYTNGGLESENNVGMSQNSSQTEEPDVKVDDPNQIRCLVPGRPSDSWSEFEADCFLLGLYIYGKNLLQVMRFMESKGLGQILAYYYGRFYRSSEYRRWSECRKMKNRKCVLGHRFFTGYRQQELFVRLSPHLSEVSKTKWLEVSRAFMEGRTSLDEYIFSLKALVGIHALVKAVGIGKGREDLTTLILDSSKNNQMFTQRPEIPSGKACSSLTCAEIVKYLTGDFRLSKARSNDLFWEAVWPRLLARGWHSEQPRGEGYAGSKNCLVFLMPGIKKFSRRKLTKGDHYFDSVSDVLAKVASEPDLLVLEADEAGSSNSKVENGWVMEVKSDVDKDSSDHERHCYLKPRVSFEIANLFKFTVVDTSLAHEGNPSKVRELKSLPHEAKKCSSRKSNMELEVKSDTMKNGLQSPTIMTVASASERMPGISNAEPLKKPADGNLLTDHKSRTIKHQFSRRIKPGLTSCSGSVTKRRRLASCLESDVTCVLSLPARTTKKKSAASRGMATSSVVPSRVSQADHLKVIFKEPVSSSTPNETIPQDSSLIHVSSELSRENGKMPQTQRVFDLNEPQVPSEPESDGHVRLEGENDTFQQTGNEKLEEHSNTATVGPSATMDPLVNSAPVGPVSSAVVGPESSVAVGPVSSATVGPSDKGGDVIDQQPRRQSTRNRPLTTKALEALEIGFLNPVRHSRKRSPSLTQDKKSKRPRQPRSTLLPSPSELLGLPETSLSAAVAGENGNGKTDTLGMGIPTDKTGLTSREMLGLPETSFSPAGPSKEMFT